MWPFGKIACVVCGECLSKHELKISFQDEKIAVCRYCFEGWWIRGIGLDCGGVPLSS